MFQVALQILQNNKKQLLAAKDDGEALLLLGRYTDRLKTGLWSVENVKKCLIASFSTRVIQMSC